MVVENIRLSCSPVMIEMRAICHISLVAGHVKFALARQMNKILSKRKCKD